MKGARRSAARRGQPVMIIFTGGYKLCAEGRGSTHLADMCLQAQISAPWQAHADTCLAERVFSHDIVHMLRDSAANYLVLPYRDVEYRVSEDHDTRLITWYRGPCFLSVRRSLHKLTDLTLIGRIILSYRR